MVGLRSTHTFGILHVPTGNFLDWRNTREAAEAQFAHWLEEESDLQADEFEIVEFDAKGMPV